jgi:sucrose-6-phosphate hydrolase SacC (GH32 family)
VRRIVADFGETPVRKIKPADIDAWLSRATTTPTTANRYRALFSIVFREAVRNGKLTSNPARLWSSGQEMRA